MNVFTRLSVRTLVLLSTLTLGITTLYSQTRTIQGVVKDAQSGERLPNATLMIKGTKVGAKSNLEGFFVLPNAPDSQFVLEARFVGYGVEEVKIPSGQKPEDIVLELTTQDVLLQGVTVFAEEATVLKTESEPSLSTISPRQLLTLPNVGQPDIFRSMQLLPGVSGTNDRESGLYVRGGTPDQNLILFDGMTVYHVDHFFGFFSAFNPDAVKDVQFYKGGYPAEYGGRLSSVVDMTGKAGDPNNLHIGAGLNLLSGDVNVGIPLFGQGSFLVAFRRSYSDIIQSSAYTSLYDFLTGSSSSTSSPRGFGVGEGRQRFSGFSTQSTPTEIFHDLNSKLTYNLTSHDIVSASFYNSIDNLDNSQQGSTLAFPGSNLQVTTPPTTDITQQGNLGASAKWFHQWTDRLYSNILVATAKYTSDYDYDVNRTNPNAATQNQQSTDEQNIINDNSFRIDNQWILDNIHDVSFGTEVSRTDAAYSLAATTVFNQSQAPFLDSREQAMQTAVYVQDKWSRFAGTLLDLTLGLRTTAYTLTSQTFWEPRFSWRYLLTENVSLKGAYGVYHQFVNRIINQDLSQGSRDFWVLSDNSLQPGGAIHYILGGTWENQGYLFDVEGYYKSLDNLVEFSQRFRITADDLYSFYSGSGTSRGVELLLQKKQGTLNGWISYTLGRAENVFPELNNGNPFPADQDQTHELKIVGNLALGDNWTASSTFIFGSGTPYTSPVSQYAIQLLDGSNNLYTHVSDMNAYRLPSYQRLDASISKRFGEENSSHWLVGVSAFNLLNHTNIAYYQYDLSTDPIHVTEVTGLGFTPTIFVQVDFQ